MAIASMPVQKSSSFHNVMLFMSKKVFTIQEDKKLIGAKEIMDWAHIRHVPVVNAKQEVVGMISHRDLLAASISSAGLKVSDEERNRQLGTIPLQSVMRSPVKTIDTTATIQEAARMMRSQKIGCLPVVERGKLVGILTDYDLLRVVEEL